MADEPPPSSQFADRRARLRAHRLLVDPVGRTLLALAGPSFIGIAAVIMFMVVDTFFVGRLGPKPLAAMSFCFPVMFVVFSITMGVGIGTTSVIARTIGEGDRERVRRVTTDALILAVLVVLVVAGVGLSAMTPIFRLMGADDTVMPLIRSYMTPWFCGCGLLVIPMVGNSAIRATGDTRSPSVIMLVAVCVNAVLDPLLIFGIGPFPELGLPGAAYASVLSWLVTFSAALWLLVRREKMIAKRVFVPATLWSSWKPVLHVGLPAAATNLLVPLSSGILTRIIAGYGSEAVAAFGVATRVESLAMVGIQAMSTALTPFVGQNFGANQCNRIRQGYVRRPLCIAPTEAREVLGGGLTGGRPWGAPSFACRPFSRSMNR